MTQSPITTTQCERTMRSVYTPMSVRCSRPAREGERLCGVHLGAQKRRAANAEKRRAHAADQNYIRIKLTEQAAQLGLPGAYPSMDLSGSTFRGLYVPAADIDSLLSRVGDDFASHDRNLVRGLITERAWEHWTWAQNSSEKFGPSGCQCVLCGLMTELVTVAGGLDD